MKTILVFFLAMAGLMACGGAPTTNDNPLCTRNGDCTGTQICCAGVCDEPSMCTADTVDTNDVAEAVPDTTPSEETTLDTSPETTLDTAQPETVADTTTDTNDTADTTQPETETVADTANEVADTTDTRVPEGYVLVDPGMHTRGRPIKGGGLMLLDGRLDGRSRVCDSGMCVEGGIVP